MSVYLGLNKVGPSFTTEKPDDQYGFLKNSQLIKTVTYDLPLSSTNFSSLTPTTSNQNLTLPTTVYTTTAGTSIVVARVGEDYDGTIINRTNYDYVIISEGYWTYAFTQSAETMNTMIHGIKTGMCRDYQEGSYYGISSTGQLNATSSTTGTYCTNQCVTLYRKTNGTYASTSSYGITTSGTTGGFSTSNGKDYINLSVASVAIRAHASYFPVEAMQYIDPANTTLHFVFKIYQGDKSVISTIYKTAYDYIALS